MDRDPLPPIRGTMSSRAESTLTRIKNPTETNGSLLGRGPGLAPSGQL